MTQVQILTFAMQASWVNSSQSITLHLTYLTGLCENITKERRMISHIQSPLGRMVGRMGGRIGRQTRQTDVSVLYLSHNSTFQ